MPDKTPTRLSASADSPRAAWAPPIEEATRGDDLVVSTDLPGVKLEDAEVETEGDNLIIRGESRSEPNYGTFYRRIPLPSGIDIENARAELKDGVLKVVFPGGAKVLVPQRHPIVIQISRPQAEQPEEPQAGQTAQDTAGSEQKS
jgi:HSP20 family molecular chaperone IbpA